MCEAPYECYDPLTDSYWAWRTEIIWAGLVGIGGSPEEARRDLRFKEEWLELERAVAA